LRYIIDRDLVAAEIERSRETLAAGRWRWFRRTFTYVAAPLYLVTIALQWRRMTTFADQPVGTQLAILLLPGLFAAGSTWWSMRVLFNRRALDVDTQVREIAESLRSVAGYGWMKRAVRTGVALSLGVGIPLGALLMLVWPPAQLPAGNRWLVIPLLVAITALWMLPGAFLFRWLSLVALRRFVRAVPDEDGDQRTSA
jgi:hypothetical protein